MSFSMSSKGGGVSMQKLIFFKDRQPGAYTYSHRTITPFAPMEKPKTKCRSKHPFLKGTVARDFWPLVFFMNGPNKDP
jgi:hypothetical protein